MSKYDKLQGDLIHPINFTDMGTCPKCGNNTLVILDHEFNISSINPDGYFGEVLSSTVEEEVGCSTCGFKTKMFTLDREGRIKLCTEAELIYENDQRKMRVAKRAKEIARTFVGLKSKEENPFMSQMFTIEEVTHF